MARIALLHPGSMGAAVGQALREIGHEVGWIPAGRGAETAARAAAAGLIPLTDLDGIDAVVSLVPPAAAVETAREVAEVFGFSGLYIDANAISPERASEVADIVRAGGATYVDGGVVGPPPMRQGTTRVFLSGDAAHVAAELFAGSRLEPVIASGEFGASAVKLAYASWTKIGSALLLEAERTAEAYGVATELRAEWARSQPDVEQRLAVAHSSAAEKGWRWVDEMRQIAAAFEAAGAEAGFGEAAAAVFERFRAPDPPRAAPRRTSPRRSCGTYSATPPLRLSVRALNSSHFPSRSSPACCGQVPGRCMLYRGPASSRRR